MGKRKKNAKKKKRNQAQTQQAEKERALLENEEQTPLNETEAFVSGDESEADALLAEPILIEEKETETTYEELFAEETNDEEKSQAQEIDLLKDRFRRSLVAAGRRELSGKRRVSIPVSLILSKILWTAIVFALVGIIVWQSAEVVAAKIEYKRSNEFYIDLSNKLSLSKGETGLNATLYGEKGISGNYDYVEMQNGAVIIDKHTLTNSEKKELAVINAKLAALKKLAERYR